MTEASEIVLLGYNPGVRLIDAESGRPTAFVSIWGWTGRLKDMAMRWSRRTVAWCGHRLPGETELSGTTDRPSSTAYLSHTETWRRNV